MTDVIPFKHPRERRRELREEAAAWMSRVDAGLAPEERQRLEAWLARDRGHLEVFMELAVLWDQMSVLTELADLFPLENYVPGKGKARKSRGWLPGLAAAAVLLVSLALVLSLYDRPEQPSSSYSTAVGEQRSITLPDGSVALLNTDSQLVIDFTASARNLELIQGEALFTVTHDADMPFRVRAGDRVVEAVGTAFSVQRNRAIGNIEIIVSEGEVRVGRRSAPSSIPAAPETRPPVAEADLLLSAGHFISMNEGENELLPEEIPPEDIEVRLSWQHGMLLFQNEPLEEVLQEVARYTSTTIEADESLRDLRVEGYFRVGDIDGLLMAMQNNFQVEIRRISDSHIYLSGSQ